MSGGSASGASGASASAGAGGGGARDRIRFREAVPSWRDRHDLRRRFRRAACASMGERKTEMAAVLGRLSADHVPLSVMIPEAQGMGTIAVFADGTRLLLGIRCGAGTIERFGRGGPRRPVWIADVQPCFGCRWFWLGFTSDARAAPLEVLASVGPVPPGCPENCPG